MYHLDNAFLLDNPFITVVGCGGTGGFVAESLCRLFQGREVTIVLVDHDRVEPHNLLRQNFFAEDVGRFKSQALAERLTRAYGRAIGYSVYALQGLLQRLLRTELPGPASLRRQPGHRVRRQRRRTKGDGGLPAGTPQAVAHRRGQRHKLGPGAGRQRASAVSDEVEGWSLRRRDLLPAARAHAAAARPADRRVHEAARRGLCGGPSTSPTRTRPSTR